MRRLSGQSWWVGLILVALGAWSLVPLAYLVGEGTPLRLLTGADGPFAGDQLQYMSWIRSVADSGLAGNGFDLRTGSKVFVHPMFSLSGLLVWLGLPIQLAVLIWKPVTVVALLGGVWAYAARTLEGVRSRAAGVFLGVFACSPLLLVFREGDLPGRDHLTLLAGEAMPAARLWGYLPAAMSVALMPIALICVTRLLRTSASGRGESRALLGAGLAGALVSWLHPWQGGVLLLTVVLSAIGTELPYRVAARRLAPALLAWVLPLAYYAVLARADSAWELAYDASRAAENGGRPLLALVPAFAPLVAVAAFGVRLDRNAGVLERSLLAWPVVTLVVYLVSPTFPAHVLTGVTVPLAVLSVRGWQRVTRRPRPALAVAALALAVVPGAWAAANIGLDVVREHDQPSRLSAGERSALAYLDARSGRGGVLASDYIGAAVPAFTGRRVWSGHPNWTTNYWARQAAVAALFRGRLRGARARLMVRSTGARWLLADCRAQTDLARSVGGSLLQRRDFGCAAVYVVR